MLVSTLGGSWLKVSDDSLALLSWELIRTAWANACVTEVAREQTGSADFLAGIDEVRRVYAQVGDLSQLEERGVLLALGTVFDVRPSLDLVKRGGVIDKVPLWELTQTLDSLRAARKQLLQFGDGYPALAEMADHVPDLALLAAELVAPFDASGEIRDDASPELRAARSKLTSLTKRTKKRLDDYLKAADVAEYVQDDYYTQRDGRFVLPVISSFQHHIQGIIHGTSNTGQTVYIEPNSFIEANNQLALLHAEVRHAMRQVLVDRSAWVADEGDQVTAALSSLIQLDQLQARVRLANSMGASLPRLSEDGTVFLRHAKSPALLLQGETVVANDISLAADQSFIIVTGPNTGGKTVTLTTLGSMSLMVAAGLPIPAAPDSTIPYFPSVFALGGDLQDIGRNLSTFSGHMLALRGILEDATSDSLVLLDEIAIGTEPQQGAALAVSVLEALARRGARGFVTTHYERLKLLAFQDDTFANASVGVESTSGRPNYRLTFGESGASSPFDVVERLGFPSVVVGRARAILSGSEDVEHALSGLRQAQRELTEARDEAEKERALLESQRREIARERARLKTKAVDAVRTLTADARKEVERALAEVREQVKGLQDVGDAQELQRRRKRLIAAQQSVGDIEASTGLQPDKTQKSEEDTGPALSLDVLSPGVAIHVRSLGRDGSVVQARSDKEILVSVGPMKLTVPLKDLRPPQAKEPGSSKQSPVKSNRKGNKKKKRQDEYVPVPDYESPPPRTDNITVDLRGMRRDEVADILLPALDQAYMNSWEALWVIHGHGTGAVRDEVRQLLRNSPYPRHSRAGLRHEGGNGVTIVWLDNR